MSTYDKINSAKELVHEIMNSGLSATQEDINRVQDIFGHATMKELVELANDNGRNNDKHEPDPKGTWSSNRRPTQSTFYSILFQIWNWEDATRFWNQHTNPENEDLRSRIQEVEHDRKEACGRINDLTKNLAESRNIVFKTEALNIKLTDQLEEKENEIVKLKAKLYDLMTTKDTKEDN